MKKKILICSLVLGLGVGTATAQLGNGVVFDPTNYHNALLRYYQLQEHLAELQKSYAKITSQLNLAMQMAQFIKNMPARYRALFSQWRNVTSLNTFGNTVSWINGINTGVLPNINTGYLKATNPLSQYDPYELSGMDSPNSGASSPNTPQSNSPIARTSMPWPPSVRFAEAPTMSRRKLETSKTIPSRAIPVSTARSPS